MDWPTAFVIAVVCVSAALAGKWRAYPWQQRTDIVKHAIEHGVEVEVNEE